MFGNRHGSASNGRATRLLVLLILAAPWLAGCGGIELTSQWKDRDIAVDGLDTEWDGTRFFVSDAKGSIGVLNDGDYLYVCLTTSSEDIRRQVLAQGFTLWFDPNGGKDRVFGIRFPLGMGGPAGPPRMGGRDDLESITHGERFQRMARRLELIGPDEGSETEMLVGTVEGIDVRMRVSESRFTYELRVPIEITQEHPFAIGSHVSEKIGIRFESPRPGREKMRERMKLTGRPGGLGGGKGGGRMGGGGRGGSMSPGHRPEMPEQFDFWAKVVLASAGNESVGNRK